MSVRSWSTADPTPRTREIQVEVPEGKATVQDDAYSDRIRCDHPDLEDGGALGTALLDAAQDRGRGRVVALVDPDVAEGLEEVGFVEEGRMPGFYSGEDDCHVMGGYVDSERGELARAEEDGRVKAILDRPGADLHPTVDTRRAGPEDAEAIAHLLAETFLEYPTPSGHPAYIEHSIREGIPFRIVEEKGEIVACASADLVREAKTAELTDCATRPEQRGRGLMQAILLDLMEDLRGMGYPTAFTLARARIPGVNIAFRRLGFELRGTMPRSCRIGDGIEDMNIWSRPLDLN